MLSCEGMGEEATREYVSQVGGLAGVQGLVPPGPVQGDVPAVTLLCSITSGHPSTPNHTTVGHPCGRAVVCQCDLLGMHSSSNNDGGGWAGQEHVCAALLIACLCAPRLPAAHHGADGGARFPAAA